MNKYNVSTIRNMAEYITGKNFWEAGDLRFADGPAGLRVQGDGGDSLGLKDSLPATSFPAHSALACSFNRSLVYEVARCIGVEAAACGVDILLAPAINIKRCPYNGRNFEYFSEDSYLSGELGTAFVEGVQSTGVGACVKHFVANNRETARCMSDSVMSERTLHELYLPAFETIVKNSAPAAVMTSYNKLNGTYCNESRELIQGILRGEWGFKGLVISDWGGTYDRVKSVKAGADLEMPACAVSCDMLVKAYERGELSGEEIEACEAHLKMASARPKPQKTQYDAAKHAETAYRAACESIVLLKNDGVLPLAQNTKVAVFGEAAKNAPVQGGGSSHVHQSEDIGFLSEIAKVCTVTGYIGGYKKLNNRAMRLIENSDVIIVCLAMYDGDTEGQDKSSLYLSQEQINLVTSLQKTGKKVVALLTSGGAIDTSWDRNLNALLYLGLSGEGSTRAAADIVCGKVNPSGRLAESFFNTPDELPSVKYFNQNEYYTVYAEGCAVGYRYYLSQNVSAKYPFGFGLSYTNFTYSQPIADIKGVRFTVTNTGSYNGAVTPQIYIEFPKEANSISPVLAGFEKVFLAAGESREVFIPFTENTFSSYDVTTRKKVIVSGKYSIRLAKSSQDIVYVSQIDITGNSAYVPADEPPQNEPALPEIKRNKRGRVIAELSTPFGELKNSKALLVRLFVKSALYFMRKNPMQVGTLRYSPVKTVAQFAAFDSKRTEGFLQILNGHYFKGISLMIKGKSLKKRKKK